MKCSYVKDLYPIFLEGLVSEETKKDLEQHLEECEACRNTLLEPAPDIKVESSLTETESLDIQKKAIRRYKKKYFGIIATAVALVFIVGGGGVLGYNFYERHPHKAFSISVPSKFNDINFNDLGKEIARKTGLTADDVRTVHNGVMVEINPDGTVRNIDSHFETRSGHYSQFYNALYSPSSSKTGILQVNKYPPHVYFIGESRKLSDILSAFSKLSLSHIQSNTMTESYKWLNIVFTDNPYPDIDVSSVTGKSGDIGDFSYIITPKTPMKWFVINKEGGIKQFTQQTTIDMRNHVMLFVIPNITGADYTHVQDASDNEIISYARGAQIAYVVEI